MHELRLPELRDHRDQWEVLLDDALEFGWPGNISHFADLRQSLAEANAEIARRIGVN